MAKVSSRLFIFLLAFIFITLFILFSPFMLMAWLYDRKTTPKISWLKEFALVIDLGVNLVMGGHHKTYVSSILGYLQTQGSRGGTYAAKVVNWFWLKIFKESDHCRKAMKPTDFYDFSASRALLGTSVYCLNLYLIYIGIQAL